MSGTCYGVCGSVLMGLRLLIEHIPHHLIGVEGLGEWQTMADGQTADEGAGSP